MAGSRTYINKSWFKTLRAPLKKLKPPIEETEQQGAIVLKRGSTIVRFVNEGDSTGLVAVQTSQGETLDYVSLRQPQTPEDIKRAIDSVLALFAKAERLAKP